MSSLSEETNAALLAAAAEVMTVESVTRGDASGGGLAPLMTRHNAPTTGERQSRPTPESMLLGRAVLRVTGVLQMPADAAHRCLIERLGPLGFTPMLRGQTEHGATSLLVLPITFTQTPPNVALAGTLFLLTALSCLFVGAMNETGVVSPDLRPGIPFAASLLTILLAHELGHYFTARRLGAPVSLPYFIPLPLPPLGTMGAIINMPAPPRDRRQLFAIGVAGPLCGLLIALPILWIGLGLSHVQLLPASGYQLEGNSLLYALIKFVRFGRLLPGGGEDVFIHPIAFGGWVGLLVTSLNLIPAGQLDGGHIAYAVLGKVWADRLLWVILIGLAALSFLWVGWLLWVVLIFLVSRVRLPLLNDITTLTSGQRILGVIMLLVFVLVFIPVPFTIVP